MAKNQYERGYTHLYLPIYGAVRRGPGAGRGQWGAVTVGQRRRPEQSVHRAVVQHLMARAAPGLFWCHVPNGGARSKVEAAIFRGLGVTAGVPDLLLIHRGAVYGLELKAARGRVTPAQTAVHERMRMAGATVATATGIDDALAILEGWNLIRGVTARGRPST